jgi:hypothetical protein
VGPNFNNGRIRKGRLGCYRSIKSDIRLSFWISKIKTKVVIVGVGTAEILDDYVLVIWSKIVVIFCINIEEQF